MSCRCEIVRWFIKFFKPAAILKQRYMASQMRIKNTNTSGDWIVNVDDNYHYMDPDERYVLGLFETYEDAVCACKRIVDTFLAASSEETAEEMFEGYVAHGEDPWIKGPSDTGNIERFSAREYARQRCAELRPENI